MSDHHHHDDGQRVRTIYAVSIGIVILIAAALFWVTQSSGTKAHAGHKRVVGHGHTAGDGHGHAPTKARARLVRPGARRAMGQRGAAGAIDASPAGRVRYAHKRQMAVRRHDKSRMVLAMGKERDIFEMRFSKGAKGDSIERLKKAGELFTELKSRGFRQLRVRVGRSIAFTKNL